MLREVSVKFDTLHYFRFMKLHLKLTLKTISVITNSQKKFPDNV